MNFGLGNISVGLKLDTSHFDAGMKRARSALNSFGSIAAGAAAAGVASVGAGAAYSAMKFGELEQAITEAATVSDQGAKAFNAFFNAALSQSNDVEHSAVAMAGGLKALSMAGNSATDSMGALRDMANLVTVSGIEFGDAADKATNIVAGFGLEMSELSRVNDVLARTFTNANVDIQQIAKTFEYVGPVAAAFEQDIEDIATATGLLGNAGLQGEKAGTALRSMFVRLAKPMRTTRQSMKALGVSLTDGGNKMRSLRDIIGDLEEAQKRLTKTDFAEHLARVAGTEGLPAVMVLVEQGVEGFDRLNTKVRDTSVTMEMLAENMRNTISAQMKILKGQLDNASIVFGQILAPAIRIAQGEVKNFTSQLINSDEGFNQIKNGVADAIAGLKSMIPVFVAVLKAAGYVSAGIAKIASGFSLLGDSVDYIKLEYDRKNAMRGPGGGDDAEVARIAKQQDKLRKKMLGTADAADKNIENILNLASKLDQAGDQVGEVFGKMEDAVRKTDRGTVNSLANAEKLRRAAKKYGEETVSAAGQAQEALNKLDYLTPLQGLKDELMSMGDVLAQSLAEGMGKGLSNIELMGEILRKSIEGEDVSGLTGTLKSQLKKAMASEEFAKINADILVKEMENRVKLANLEIEPSIILDDVLDGFESAIGELGNVLTIAFDGTFDGAGSMLKASFEGLAAAVQNASSLETALAAGLKNFAQSAVQAILETDKAQSQIRAFGDHIASVLGGTIVTDLLTALDAGLGVFHVLIETFSGIWQFGDLLEFISVSFFNYAKMLSRALLGFFRVTIYLEIALLSAADMILSSVTSIIDKLNSALSKLPGVGDNFIQLDGLDAAQRQIEGALNNHKDGLEKVNKGMEDLKNISYESAKEEARRRQEEAKARRNLEELNSALKNAPSGFKIAAARFAASDGAMRMMGRSHNGDQGGDTIINIYGVRDTAGVLNEISRRAKMRTGSASIGDFHARDAFERIDLVG